MAPCLVLFPGAIADGLEISGNTCTFRLRMRRQDWPCRLGWVRIQQDSLHKHVFPVGFSMSGMTAITWPLTATA